MKNKIVYVKAKFQAIGENKTTKIPTGEKKKTLLGLEINVMREEEKWVQTGFSDCFVDGELLSQELQQAIDQLNNEDYEVVGISEIISGNWNFKWSGINQGGYGYGYGYSYTEGLIILARKK